MSLKEQLYHDLNPMNPPEGSTVECPEGEIKKYTFVWDDTNHNCAPEWHIMAEWENGYQGIITGEDEVDGVKFLSNFIGYLAKHS